LKKYFYGTVKEIGCERKIGYIPVEEYYIDKHSYLFGFKIKTVRYWNYDDYLKNKNLKNVKRKIVKGFSK